MKSNAVIVYGSGASYASGYMVNIELLIDDIDKSKTVRPPTDQYFFDSIPAEYINIRHKALSKFIQLFYPPKSGYSLEQIWTDVDINHKHITLDTYNWKPESEDYLHNQSFDYLSMDLINEYFDGKYFDTSPRYNRHKFLGDCGRDFRKLVYDVYSNYTIPTGDDNFRTLHDSLNSSKYSNVSYVTFNYDCYLEQSLGDIRLKYIGINDTTDSCAAIMYDHIPIIKLHGSLNWAESRNGAIYKIVYSPFPFTKDSQIQPEYKGDRSWIQPAIVPPTILKQEINDDSRLGHDLTKTILQQWRAAITLLAEADLIIIIGYSFPTADYHVGRLFRVSNMISKGKNRHTPTVIYCGGPKDNSDDKIRFIENIYGNGSIVYFIRLFENLIKSDEYKNIIK